VQSIASQASGSIALAENPYDSLHGFQGGDFSSGKVKHINLPTGCWTMAFSVGAGILATGLKNRVELLETANFSLLCSIPRTAKVSAIQWCTGLALLWGEKARKRPSDQNHHGFEDGEIVAVAGLDGHVGVYHLDPSLVEFKGTQTINEFQVDGEIRCMTFKPLVNGGAILAVGDKQGKVTLVTLSHDEENGEIAATYPIVIDFEGDAVLGLDCHVGEQSFLAASTKSGKVIVYELVISKGKIGSHYVAFGNEIWSIQRNGSVRSVLITSDGKYLAFGGYDKTLVRVNLSLLAVVRELNLQGTINTIASDPLNRFLVVGCRDKSITVFDTSTFFPIKRFETPGWVTVSNDDGKINGATKFPLTPSFSLRIIFSQFPGGCLAYGQIC
jgi:WD40 repeat protein